MYLSHFQLMLDPFQLDTDNRFIYLNEKHEEALANLRYGILGSRGILVLTGDVGTGKTILIHALVETLGPDVHTAILTDPNLKGVDFFNFISHAFGMGTESKSKGDFLFDFSSFLASLVKANQQALLIIDEAQQIDAVQLEEIRMLSALEGGNALLNILFVGQDQFGFMIANKRLRALKQRITAHYHIAPLTLEETGLYVQYRLKVAGCERPLFTPSALEKIFGLTNGYPRLVNVICDHCLLTAFEKGLLQIDSAIVTESAADLMHPSQLNAEAHTPLESMPSPAVTPPADAQPVVGPPTPPGAASHTTKPVGPPGRPLPFASLLPTLFRKPAYLLTVAILLGALAWFIFKDNRGLKRQAAWISNKNHQASQIEANIESIQSPAKTKHLRTPQDERLESPAPAVEADKNAPPNVKAEAAEMVSADRVDRPTPSASPMDASTAVVDAPPERLAAPPSPATAQTEPTTGQLEGRNTEMDPRAIIDFVIRKRSMQSGDP